MTLYAICCALEQRLPDILQETKAATIYPPFRIFRMLQTNAFQNYWYLRNKICSKRTFLQRANPDSYTIPILHANKTPAIYKRKNYCKFMK